VNKPPIPKAAKFIARKTITLNTIGQRYKIVRTTYNMLKLWQERRLKYFFMFSIMPDDDYI
jgi:hypothetical protein